MRRSLTLDTVRRRGVPVSNKLEHTVLSSFDAHAPSASVQSLQRSCSTLCVRSMQPLVIYGCGRLLSLGNLSAWFAGAPQGNQPRGRGVQVFGAPQPARNGYASLPLQHAHTGTRSSTQLRNGCAAQPMQLCTSLPMRLTSCCHPNPADLPACALLTAGCGRTAGWA